MAVFSINFYVSYLFLAVILSMNCKALAFPTTQTSTCSTRATSWSSTELAYTLPSSLNRVLPHNKHWYQEIGSAVDRHIVYNDEDYFGYDDDDDDCFATLSLGFARLNTLEDAYFPSDASPEQAPTGGKRRPLRAIRGVWSRVRRRKVT